MTFGAPEKGLLAGRPSSGYGSGERASLAESDWTSFEAPFESRTRRVPPLGLALDPSSPAPLHRQIGEQMRRAILEGRLEPGARLPSSRLMAQDLDCARGTVVLAFDQLVAEGYVVSQAGSAMSVAANLPDEMLTVPRTGTPSPGKSVAKPAVARRTRALLAEASPPVSAGPPLAFPTGQPDREAFPFALWAKLLEREWRRPGSEAASAVHPFGHAGLREAIATYLGVARGFTCDPAEVVVTTGIRHGLSLFARGRARCGRHGLDRGAGLRRRARGAGGVGRAAPCRSPSTSRASRPRPRRRWRPRRAWRSWRRRIIFRSAPCSACSAGSSC